MIDIERQADVYVLRMKDGENRIHRAFLGQPGMTALIAARLPKSTAHEAIVTGRRYGGSDAVARGVADCCVPEAEVLDRAVSMARELSGKDRDTLRALKRGLYRDTLDVLLGQVTQ